MTTAFQIAKLEVFHMQLFATLLKLSTKVEFTDKGKMYLIVPAKAVPGSSLPATADLDLSLPERRCDVCQTKKPFLSLDAYELHK